MRRGALGLGVAVTALLAGGAALATDGVIEINEAKALAGGVTSADGPGYPVTLVVGASYVLTSDLVVTHDDTVVIEDATPPIGSGRGSIHLDLNGFSIRCQNGQLNPDCANGSGRGIRFDDASDVTIENGSIVRMGASGIEVATAGARIDRMHVVGNAPAGSFASGIECGDACQVTRCVVRANGGTGVRVGDRSHVVDVIADGNGVSGVAVGRGSNVRDSTMTNNISTGLTRVDLDDTFTYGGNSLMDNNAGGNQVSLGGIQTGTNFCQGDTVCP